MLHTNSYEIPTGLTVIIAVQACRTATRLTRFRFISKTPVGALCSHPYGRSKRVGKPNPYEGSCGGLIRCFPKEHRSVRTRAGKQLSIRAERHTIDPFRISDEYHSHRFVPTRAGKRLSVRAECHTHSLILMPGESACSLVTASHSRTVPSPLPLASVFPSGLNATLTNRSVWPVSRATARSVVVS